MGLGCSWSGGFGWFGGFLWFSGGLVVFDLRGLRLFPWGWVLVWGWCNITLGGDLGGATSGGLGVLGGFCLGCLCGWVQ